MPAQPSSPKHSTPRILYLIDEIVALTAGGTERQILQMAFMMQRTGAQVQLCALRGTEWLRNADVGVPVHFADFKGLSKPSGWASLLALVKWMRSQQFDILQTFFVESNLLAPLLGRLSHIPVTLGSRRNLNYWMSAKTSMFQRISNRFVTRLVANSEVVKRAVAHSERTDPGKIDVIYNAIDLALYQEDQEARARIRKDLGVAEHEILIGNTSALRPIKGTETFVKAAAILRYSYSNAKWILVGDGPLRMPLTSMAEQAGLRDAFIFAGAQTDVPRFLQTFDIAVLCSDSEGFSNSILEYMAMGLPVVATDVGGNAEALGETGKLVPPGDPAALAAAIREFIDDPEFAKRSGQQAKERVKMFAMDTSERRLQDYYSHLLRASHTKKSL